MHPQEITTSLDAPHIAVVATVNWNATPHVPPNGYRYDGKVLTFITRTDRLKYRHRQGDPRISVCIDDPPVASNDVIISERAICHDQDIWDEARRIIAHDRAPAEWTALWRAGNRSRGYSSW